MIWSFISHRRDCTGRGRGEMRREHGRGTFRCSFQEPASRLAGCNFALTETAVPVRSVDLQGLVHDVATEQSRVAAGREFDGDMTNAVSGRGMECEVIDHVAEAVDQKSLSRCDHRKDAIFENAGIEALTAGRTRPVIMLCFREHVFGVGKGRHPAAVAQTRIPAAMVGVKMRAKHVVDGLWGNPDRRQATEKRQVELIETRDRAYFSVSAT